MRPIHVSVIAGLSLATLGTSQASFIEGELSGAVSVGANTEYIFRGIDQGGGAMAEAGLNWGGISFFGFDYNSSLWYASVGNDGSSGPFRGSFDELDYQSGLSRDLGFMTLEVGQILYSYIGGDVSVKQAQEVYFTASRSQWDFDFAFTYYWAIDEDNDGYSELTIDRSFALSECLALALGGTVSYNWESSEIHHYGLSAALNWEYNDVLTISPYVSATFAQDGIDELLNGSTPSSSPFYYDQGDELFGGVVLTASF